MSDTGRIGRGLPGVAREIVFGRTVDAELEAELPPTTLVDLAHVVMLGRQGLLSEERARVLLAAVLELRRTPDGGLRGRPAPRGLYLLYEEELIRRVGIDAGGSLHTARSRNDLKATVLVLRLREAVDGLLGDALRLQAVLLRRARRHRDVLMPAYTQHQPAVPTTFGHYLLGVACALDRDLAALQEVAAGLLDCPLGAGAVAGTELPIDAGLAARLLGFERPVRHSIDAVASRDHVLRLLAAACFTTVTLSRLAADLQTWTSGDVALVDLPDELVGSSSAMPQKRNAYLLEHVKAKAAQTLGALTASTAAMKATPFTNSVEVGTEAVAPVWDGLRAARDAVVLSRLVVAAARPDADRMRGRVDEGWTTATAVANQLVARGVPFRAAHHRVGRAVRSAIDSGAPAGTASLVTALAGEDGGAPVDAALLEPGEIVRRSEHGGGPGPESLERTWRWARGRWCGHMARLVDRRARRSAAAAELAHAVREVTGTPVAPDELLLAPGR